MKIIITKDYNNMSKLASEIVIKEIKKKPNLVVAFPTGKTPLGLCELLVRAYKNKKIDFSDIKTFRLDEYYPIKANDKKSLGYSIQKNLLDKVNIRKDNINTLNTETKGFDRECRNYEAKIRKNKIDLMILGVGVNGHIAFNEPGSLEGSKTRLVELTPETIKRNKIKKIKNALTIGVSTIMKSEKIILLASGKDKAEAIRCLMKCKPDKCCPISFLKKHKNLIVIIDKEAGRLIS
ncbi:MAG: glucosamine-6-phosphate deaminase [Candidatus Nanoarchaeia archaeon]|nr:glucosamine-6-phosphate deaminase [Candidatus Nanoarchaeia archaeon]MDD5741089.1 glucosamine-6-phosphate deaminase [Candidatus Nanoarchaeia archaeon]